MQCVTHWEDPPKARDLRGKETRALMIISKCLRGYKLHGINSQIWGLESKGGSIGMNVLREAQRSRDHKEFSEVAKVVIE